MIAYLEGKIIHKSAKTIILKCQNVGYEVFLAENLLQNFAQDQEINLFIYTKVREDEITLFGFEKSSDLDFFKQLLTVNGVGPKSALEILNQNTNKIQNAIIEKNAAFLSKVPGIGKKTAEKIILELHNKLTPESLESVSYETHSIQKHFDEAIEALKNLGFQRQHILNVLEKSPKDLSTTEELITFFLKNGH